MQLGTLAFVAGTLAFGIAFAPLTTPAHAAEVETETRAQLDVIVKSTEGTKVRLGARQVAWDGTATLRKSAGDHEHAVEISMRRSADGGRIHVDLSYAVDGATLVASQDLDAALAQSVRVASADGKAEVVFVIKAEAPRERIEIDDSDDPLGGL